jgi:hypothetical protein
MGITFTHRPDRIFHYETLVSLKSLNDKMCAWLQETYGDSGKEWGGHGGWIYLRSEEDVTLFLLKWS